MLFSLVLAPLLALPALAAPNPDLMDLWPTRLLPTGTEPTTMTYAFNFPFPTTVTKVWNAPAATGTGTASGTAMAANAGTGGSGLPFNPLDPNAMTAALAAAMQQQADALLEQVKKQTITILIWCLCRRRKNKKARMVPVGRTHVRLDSESDIVVSEKERHVAV